MMIPAIALITATLASWLSYFTFIEVRGSDW